eukprot:TRINITY_DN10173_c0_g2_i1.p1 TRINITY_DN10173_c0_g2~~TRINITY_DN10173_c0_g2_i1.p1  ORF type:complete len:749 (+),score=178.72 TRINITY_DN10173_c0_g2_i1:120-2366(+)
MESDSTEPMDSKSAKITGVMKAATKFQRSGKQASMRVQKRHALVVENSSERSTRGFDQLRERTRAYEYLCHLEEAKRWLEVVLNEELPPPEKLGDRLANGVLLVKLAIMFSGKKLRIFDANEEYFRTQGVSFRHSDNVHKFITAMAAVNFPKIYHPEVPDVFERKNIPRLIYCLHALSVFLFKMDMTPKMENLVGVVDFTTDQLEEVDRTMDESVGPMPSFAQFSNQVTPDVSVAPSPARKLDVTPIKEEPVTLSPGEGYPVFWPFQLDDLRIEDNTNMNELPWLERNPSNKSIEDRFEELALEAKEAAQEAEFNALDLLSILDELPHVQDKLQAIIDDDVVDELEFAGDDDETYRQARESYQVFEEHVFWDDMYWGQAEPYQVAWPFLVDDEHDAQEQEIEHHYEQIRDAIRQCFTDRLLAVMEYVNEENYDMPTYRGSTFDELIESAFPKLHACMHEEDDSSNNQTVDPFDDPFPEPDFVDERDDYDNPDTYFDLFYQHTAYCWDDCFAYSTITTSTDLLYAHRLKHAKSPRRRRLPSISASRRASVNKVAEAVRRQRQRSRSLGLPADAALALRTRLRSSSPGRGRLASPNARKAKSANELLGTSPRSPRRLPQLPSHAVTGRGRASSRSSLSSVNSASSVGSQQSLLGDVIEGSPMIIRRREPNANGVSPSKAHMIKVDGQDEPSPPPPPQFRLHYVEEMANNNSCSSPSLLKSATIGPRTTMDESMDSNGTVGEEVDDADQWL